MLQQKGLANSKHSKFLHASTGLLQQEFDKKKDTEQGELDVLLFDCKTYIDGVQGQMDENARVRLILGEETAQARADQLEATKSKKEAEKQLESLKEEYEAHQELCGKTLTAKRAELAMAEADYNVALKIQNMSACDDEQIAAAVKMDEEEKPPTAAMIAKAHTITACSMGDSDDDDDDSDDSNAFFLFNGAHAQFNTKAAKFAMRRMQKLAMQRKLGRH